MSGQITAYRALALQLTCHAINDCPDRAAARQRMKENIARMDRAVGGSKAFHGPDLRLVVLPEYLLTSYPLGDSIPGWRDKAALEPTGPEYDALGRVASRHDVFLAGNAYESDAHFPGLYFQTSFCIDPSGSVVLRYRRLISMFAPTPHDVWERYLDVYGIEGVFPVAHTGIGRLAAIASEEILYPEIARALALRGAEVLLHSSSEAGSPRLTPKEVAKRARAIENLCYVVSANTGGIANVDMPGGSADGMSKIVDYLGEVRAEASTGESANACAEIDLEALRRYRRRPGMGNMLSRQRLELFADTYSGSIYPANTMLVADGTTRVPERSHFITTQREAIERLARAGLI
ncbi:MAG: nitrilase [Gammaproteobacteria bacterium SG8_30]|jgi:predicted amidohydrolase|nr:MAG: nitrilase [Gammaproteobacteria bacterium SG8_30]